MLAIVGYRKFRCGVERFDLLVGERAMSSAREVPGQLDVAKLHLHHAAHLQAAAFE